MNRYRKLRIRMQDKGYTAELLGEYLGDELGGKRSKTYISNCMCGRIDWRMSEIYAIAKLLEIPAHEIWLYWPPNGRTIDESEIPKREIAPEDILKAFAHALKNVG